MKLDLDIYGGTRSFCADMTATSPSFHMFKEAALKLDIPASALILVKCHLDMKLIEEEGTRDHRSLFLIHFMSHAA